MNKIKEKFKKVNLSDYCPLNFSNTYNLDWFDFLTYRKDKVVIYGVGQWEGHLMDWRGCNFFHGRLPKSPVFNNIEEAKKWLKYQVKNKVYYDKMSLSGHHAGENNCSMGCSEREIETIGFHNILKK